MNTIEHYFHRETAVHILLVDNACSASHSTGTRRKSLKIAAVAKTPFSVFLSNVGVGFPQVSPGRLPFSPPVPEAGTHLTSAGVQNQ